jgi:glycosyltransferase involved in cell wall biosynthesis
MRKKRILHIGESSFLSTGYAVYSHEVNKRLYATGKYEIAELGCFAEHNHPMSNRIPWRYYVNMPDKNNPNEVARFNARQPNNSFGEWKFEETCLDFKPDIVWDIRDWWNCEFEERSPFRQYYHWSIMPTVDAYPQHPQWLGTYINADSVFTYTDWALLVLNQSKNLIKTVGTAAPGADVKTFKPVINKKQHKANWGIPPESLIIGTVMRNQKRKLFPDLFASFAMFLKQAPKIIADKSYLYLHTSYPDWWDIPSLIHEHEISHRCLFTYKCIDCGTAFPSFYQDARGICIRCKKDRAMLPNTHTGISREELASINNLFDCYVQYANCLKPGTEVLLDRGWIPIEEVKIGDIAFTHKGKWKKVLNTFQHKKGDKPLDIKVWGDYEEITITSEHPVLAITDKNIKLTKNQSLRETIGDRIRNKQPIPDPEFIKVKDLKVGDLVAYKIDNEILDKDTIDLASYAKSVDIIEKNKIIVKNGKIYNRYIDIDEEFCRFLGLYVADGNSSKVGIRITSHKNEVENHALAVKIMKKMGENNLIGEITYIDRNAINAELYSKIHQRYFRQNCGKLLTKRLPDWAIKLPHTKIKEILCGIFMGDGCVIKKHGKETSILSITSKFLADQVKEMLRKLNIYYNSSKRIKPGNRQPQYRFEVPGNLKKGEFFYKRSNSCCLYYKNFFFSKIKSIKNSEYNDSVYNIEVENDNSYTTRVCSIHNSEGLGLPSIEAASCAVPVFAVNYSGMTDVIKKTKGYAIDVQRFIREAETGQDRAMPDNQNFVNQLIKFFQLPEAMRAKKGNEARKGILEYFDWDKTAKTWEDHFDSIPLKDQSTTWNSPAKFHEPARDVPINIDNESFVEWAITHVLGKSDLIGSYLNIRLLRDLNWQSTTDSTSDLYYNDASALGIRANRKDFTKENVLTYLKALCDFRNGWEQKRCAKFNIGL